MTDPADSITILISPRDVECLALALSFTSDCASADATDDDRTRSLHALLSWWDACYTDVAYARLTERLHLLLPPDTTLIRERDFLVAPQPRIVQ